MLKEHTIIFVRYSDPRQPSNWRWWWWSRHNDSEEESGERQDPSYDSDDMFIDENKSRSKAISLDNLIKCSQSGEKFMEKLPKFYKNISSIGTK